MDKESELSANHPVVAAAAALVPLIEASRESIVEQRRLPEALVEGMCAAGHFQLSLPAGMGGPELHPRIAFHAVEILARAEGAVGWCASISSSISLFAGGWLPRDVGREIFGNPADARTAGSVRAEGTARIVPGGYEVSGRWDFASGINHARWMFCTCVVEGDDGVKRHRSGNPVTRSLMIPREAVELIDTWHVTGLEGTGSHDFAVEGVFVPERHTFWLGDRPVADGLLFHPRLGMLSAWTTTAATSLGIARGALDAMAEIGGQQTTMSQTLLRDRPRVQRAVGEAEAILGSARAFLLTSVGEAWDAVASGAPRSDVNEAVARARLSITHAQGEAIRVVDRLFHAAGTNAVYRAHRLERCFRDAHVAKQHAAGQPSHIETAGRALLGIELKEPGW